jgi:hypothetical protein
MATNIKKASEKAKKAKILYGQLRNAGFTREEASNYRYYSKDRLKSKIVEKLTTYTPTSKKEASKIQYYLLRALNFTSKEAGKIRGRDKEIISEAIDTGKIPTFFKAVTKFTYRLADKDYTKAYTYLVEYQTVRGFGEVENHSMIVQNDTELTNEQVKERVMDWSKRFEEDYLNREIIQESIRVNPEAFYQPPDRLREIATKTKPMQRKARK